MPRAFLSGGAQKALRDVAKRIEDVSSAEIVISVRSRSGNYLHADLIVGALAGLGAMAFMLFSPYPFDLMWFLIDPVIAGAVVTLISSRLPYARRLLTSSAVFDTRVRLAAEAIFVERGVHHTRASTGLLIYISVLEQRVHLLPDSGIDEAVPRREWYTVRDNAQKSYGRGGDGHAVAKGLEPLIDLLAHHLPRADDDENELSDEVDA